MREHPYYTRYGHMTAEEAAAMMLDRSLSRLRLLEEAFAAAHQDGKGCTLKGYSCRGVAAMMEDIALDVSEAQGYYNGDDDHPGKVWNGPEEMLNGQAQ